MVTVDEIYKDIINNILNKGMQYEDPNRKGVYRAQIPYYSFTYKDINEKFPLLSIKKTFFKGIKGELLWFLKGSNDIRDLWKNDIHIWDEDYKKWLEREPSANYSLGNIYGVQWRNWNEGIDQIKKLIEDMISNKHSTSMIVNAWNPSDLNKMALPPCHYSFQVMMYKIRDRNYKYGFDLVWNQRSVDTFLGLPFNIASYALLMLILQSLTNSKAMNLHANLSNVHLYDNSIEYAKKLLLTSSIKENNPKVNILLSNKFPNITDIKMEDIILTGYKPRPSMSISMIPRD